MAGALGVATNEFTHWLERHTAKTIIVLKEGFSALGGDKVCSQLWQVSCLNSLPEGSGIGTVGPGWGPEGA